jgi:hypothetical protein
VALGGLTGMGLLDPSSVLASATAAPRPIPGGLELTNFTFVPTGADVHFLPPGIGFEMSTITDFIGVVGGSETRGTAHGSDGTRYSFDCDMRFMQGLYVGLDGRLHAGSFGFIWIDLFDPDAVGDPTKQSHDFEPGIAPSGLFWTIPIGFTAIEVDPHNGRARLHANHVAVKDYHDGFNAILGGGPDPLPSHVSFDVRWAGHGARQKIRDETFGFAGSYVASPTTIGFTASVDGAGVTYSPNAAGQYNPTVDQGGAGSPAVGIERNGRFFR